MCHGPPPFLSPSPREPLLAPEGHSISPRGWVNQRIGSHIHDHALPLSCKLYNHINTNVNMENLDTVLVIFVFIRTLAIICSRLIKISMLEEWTLSYYYNCCIYFREYENQYNETAKLSNKNTNLNVAKYNNVDFKLNKFCNVAHDWMHITYENQEK